MAPEFFPFLLCAGLVAAIVVVAVAAVFVRWPQRFLEWLFPRIVKHLRALLLVLLAFLVAVLVIAAVNIRQQYFLNEPMAMAAADGNLQRVQQLLDRGAKADSWGPDFVQTALIGAAQGGHRDVVELLLKRGADPSLKDDDGKTALERAREGGYTDIADVLVKAGARE